MLHLNGSTAYYWYNGAADMRKGFDSLCGIILEHMHSNVLQGGVYIFVNRKLKSNQTTYLGRGWPVHLLQTIRERDL